MPVVFDNLRGYDAQHLMQVMSQQRKEVKCVANMEKHITFSVGGLRFIDSLKFMQESANLLVHRFKYTHAHNKNLRKLLRQKGVYPYEYTHSWGRFDEKKLPDKKKFYSKLNDEHITQNKPKMKQGMRRVHRVLEFEQECWMQPYIREKIAQCL